MTSDNWQLLIGLLALVDTVYLIYKLRITRERPIIAAIIPRAYIAAWYLFDAFVERSTMEPARTINFLGMVLIFLTANFIHAAEWRSKHK